MAKISIEFDTVEKTCAVGMDGVTLTDVAEVSVHPDYEDPERACCRLVRYSKDKASGIRTVTHISASERPAVRAAMADYFGGGK